MAEDFPAVIIFMVGGIVEMKSRPTWVETGRHYLLKWDKGQCTDTGVIRISNYQFKV